MPRGLAGIPAVSLLVSLLVIAVWLGSLTAAQAIGLRPAPDQDRLQTSAQRGSQAGVVLAQAQPGNSHGAGMTMDAARHFIEWMVPHHDDAVKMAGFAPTQAEHPELRALAARIKRTQSEEIARMRQWYLTWYGVAVPQGGGMGMMMGGGMSMTSTTPLDGARPFDKAFVEQMIPHHQVAVMGSSMALQRVDRPELRTLLQSIITSQSAEITQMRQWYRAWYGTAVPDAGGMGMMMGGMAAHQMSSGMGSGHQMDGGMGSHNAEPSRQAAVRARGASVMPFDLNQTTHRFVTLSDGGRQSVTAKDPTNQEQIKLIRAHLAEIASRFRRGDFSDPTSIHGNDMPGVAELSASATQGRLQIVYTALPDGGQIRYTSRDPKTITALRAWFAAQLSDHGHDAVGR
jgi:uncharacterized protein (DUF305 family)